MMMMKKISGLNQILLFLVVISPALILSKLVIENSVNVPFWDQWEVAAFVSNFYSGKLSFGDFLAQQNESRLLFPRLLFVALAGLTNWDVRYEVLAILTLAYATSYNIYRLSAFTFPSNNRQHLWLTFLANLLIFSTIQWGNWIWGIQLIVFVPILCVTTCLSVACSRLNPIAKFTICVAFSTISTFSYANGVLCWIITLPMLAVSTFQPVVNISPLRLITGRKWLLLGWIFCFTSNVILYFHDYKKPEAHPSFVEALIHPVLAVRYFCSFLGAPLGFGDLLAGQIIGAILLVLFGLAVLFLLQHLHDRELLHRMLVWLSVGAYAIISGLITTAGRVGFGLEQSLSARYTTFSIYLAISLIFLVAIILNEVGRTTSLRSENKIKPRYIAASLILILVVLHALSSAHGVRFLIITQRNFLQGKACVSFVNVVYEEKCLNDVYPIPEVVKNRASVLNDLGFLKPPLVSSREIQPLSRGNRKDSNKQPYGTFDSLTQTGSNEYIASGWATLPNRKSIADAVVLTYEAPNGNSIIFAISDKREFRADVVKFLGDSRYEKAGWQKSFPRDRLPEGAHKISAWAFDSTVGEAFQLDGVHNFQE
ncbi:MAG: hypothetical protein F6K19_04925 [Cyanothece sp. SIO1E1]|nr:hypothetical protein [Cyanothece sp. SIO1E1]